MSDDFFAATGEFYDLPSQEFWRSLRAPVAEALRQVRPEQGPILDVGAGTGLATIMVAETVPAADIIAVEPSPILRAVLLSRLAPAAPLLVNPQTPSEVTAVPEAPFAPVTIGRRTYQGSAGGRPAGKDTVLWTVRYRVLNEDGSVERELLAEYRRHVLSPQGLRDELNAAGYTVEELDMHIMVATPC